MSPSKYAQKGLQFQKNSESRVHTSEAKLSLISKCKRLWTELSTPFSAICLKRVLGTSSIIVALAISDNVTAQSFAPLVTNPFNLNVGENTELKPAFADFDGDGDLDIIWGSDDGVFRYFENIGDVNNPLFASPVNNPFELETVQDYLLPTAVDLDNDGDFDLIGAGEDGTFYYFENTGTTTNPEFGSPIAEPFGLEFADDLESLYNVADLDNDGDMDVLVFGYNYPPRYYENVGTAESPQFAEPVVTTPFNISTPVNYSFPLLGDLDMDGDLDLLSLEYDYGNFYYYENVGTAEEPDFADPTPDPFGLSLAEEDGYGPPVFVDIDGDGDLDFFQVDENETLLYLENTTILSSLENADIPDLDIYPNPTADILTISTESDLQSIEVLGMNGRVVATFGNKRIISLKDLADGTYFVRLRTKQSGIAALRRIQVLK